MWGGQSWPRVGFPAASSELARTALTKRHMGCAPPKLMNNNMNTSGTLPRDRERVDRVTAALAASGFDALVCALPANVLLLTGYWPAIGNAVAIATKDGGVA